MPADFFASATSVDPRPSILLLDEQQQRLLREGSRHHSRIDEHELSPQQPSLREGDTNESSRDEDGGPQPRAEVMPNGLFVPTTPPMLSLPQTRSSLAPPPPAPTYLRTDFTTGRYKPRHGQGDAPSRPMPPISIKETRSDRNEKSFSGPFDLEPSAMPFISSTDDPKDDRPDPSRDFRGPRSNLKLSVRYMILGAVVGIGLGIVFTRVGVSDVAAQWIALPGDLFLRAINALVLPYVFCSVAVAVGDIVCAGKVSLIGLRTFKIFAMGWIVSTSLGLCVALAYRSHFQLQEQFASPSANAVGLSCANGLMLEMQPNASVTCSAKSTHLSVRNAFVLTDVNNVLQTNKDAVMTNLTFTGQLMITLESVVPHNIFASLAGGDKLAVITFASALGALTGQRHVRQGGRVQYFYLVLLQLRNTLFLAMEWVISITPVAVVSTIAGSFALNQDAMQHLPHVYMYLVACVSAAALQLFVIYPFVIFVLARCNPYSHMHHMARSYLFAFGSSSSLATAPVTLGCVQKAGVCSRSIYTFVISVGVAANFSGSGWYFPIGAIFLAESSGHGDQVTLLRLVAIFFLTLVACAAVPPVPYGGMVLMSTMYKTAFGVSTLPSTWVLFVAMDAFADRLATICNVNDDIMALRLIAENSDETVTGDQ
ncbi:hypothetical protein PsorP6_010659 [Peronosclerospora sorghi]|uniref:Uncharacterized protein n=1 Tax=Peronosclerospora sorghi TaxID=230839 RepID=A0ACC0VYE2_9STRA|nr:hypothetical protein PsorP6_010659 [Peronosclerospora sorghi]